jgi:hypothetical protein
MVLGAITDTAFIRLFRPLLSKGAVASRANKFGLKLADSPTLDNFIEAAPSKATGFKKYMEGRGGDYMKLGKELAIQAFSEGMEENIQYSNQKVNEGNNFKQSWLENAYSALNNLVSEGIYMTDEDRIKAVGAGALIGGGSAIATSLPVVGRPFGGGVLGEAKNERLQKQKAKEDLNKAYTDFVNTSLVQNEDDTKGKLTREEQPDGTVKYTHQVGDTNTEIDEEQYNTIAEQVSLDEDGNYVIRGGVKLDDQGNVMKDMVKAAEFTANMRVQGELDNLIDLEAMKQEPDPIKLKLYELEKLSNLAQTAFKSGSTDLLMKKLESFKDMGEASLKRFGIDSPQEVNDRIEFYKEHVAKLEANYLQTTNGMVAPVYGEKDEARFQMLKNYAGGIGNRLVNLYSLVEDLDRQILDVSSKIPNKQKAGWIMNAFSTDNLEGREEQSPKTSPEEARLAELVTKKKDLNDAIEDLGKVYDRLTNPREGLKEYNKLVSANKLSEYKTLRDGPKTFLANDQTTPQSFKSFVAKRSNMLRQKNKLDTARTMFYADHLNDLINYIKLNENRLEDVIESVMDVYDKVTKEGTFIYPDQALKLKDAISTTLSLIEQKEKELLVRGGMTEQDSLLDLEDMLVNEKAENTITEEDAKLYSELISFRRAKNKMRDFKEMQSKIDSQISIYDISKSDSDYVQDVLDELLQGPKRLFEIAEYEDGSISQFYDDVSAVEKQLNFAKALHEKALSKIEEKPYKETAKELEDIIKDLEILLELTKENVRNIELKNKKEDLHYAEAVLSFADSLNTNEIVITSEQTADTAAQEADTEKRRQEVKSYFEEKTKSTADQKYNPDLSGEGELALREKREELLSLGGENILAHGLSKGSIGEQFKNLLNILTNGVDKNRTALYTAPLVLSDENQGLAAAMGTAGGTAYIDGGFILLGKKGVAGINSLDDIGGVLVNQAVADSLPELIQKLKNAFPNIAIESYENSPKALKEITNLKTKETKTKVIKDVSLAQLIESDPILGSMAVMDLLTEDERADEIAEALRGTLSKLLNGLDFINDIAGTLSATPAVYDDYIKSEAVKNPLRGIFQVLNVIEKKEPDKSVLGPLIEFNKDYDVIKFKENIKNYNGKVPQETLLALINLHAAFVGIAQIQDAQESGFSHVGFLTKIREYLKANPTAPVPSSSQIRVVRELVTFASSSVISDAEIFQNGAALKAPAGAGKSLVVSKLFKYVMGYANEEIASAAAYDKAAKNIAESLGHPDNPKKITDLTTELENGTLSPKVKFIIVDEAGALNRGDINNFVRAVNKYNNTTKGNRVKYLFLYDPNQPVSGNISKPALDDNYIANFVTTEQEYYEGTEEVKAEYRKGQRTPKGDPLGHSVALSQNLKQITPLSTTYRSGVSEVVDLQNAFKSDTPISQIPTASSLDPSVSMINIFGTYAEAGTSIVKKFAESKAANPQRSRVIIVGNEEKLQQYKKALPDADVLLAPSAMGITVDEVYVDISVEDNKNFSNPTIYNQWMYAATSRATSYAHLANTKGATHFVDPKVAPYPKKDNLSEEAIKNLDEQIKVLSEITGNVSVDITRPASKEESVKPSEERTPDETPDAPGENKTATDNEGTSVGFDQQPQEESGLHVINEPVVINFDNNLPPSAPPTGVSQKSQPYNLENPAFTIFEGNEDSGIPPLSIGDELMVFIDNSRKATGEEAKRVVLVKKITGSDSGNTYYQIVGVINDKELGDFERNVGINTSKLPEFTLQNTNLYNIYKINGQVTGHETLYVQEGSQGIKYTYDGKPQEDLADMLDSDGKISKAPLLEKYIDQVWGRDALENAEEVIKNFSRYCKIIAFKSINDARKVFGKDIPASKLPRPGVPYLIIQNIKLKTGNVVKPQFIQLATKPVNSNDEKYKPLYDFIDKLKQFEDLLLKSAYLPDVYRKIKAGEPVVYQNMQFFPMHTLVKVFSDAHHDESMKTITLLSNKQAGFKNLFPDLKRESIDPKLLELASELDFLIHGDLNRVKDDKGKWKHDTRAFKGAAQSVFNDIGSQNLVASIDQGERAGKLVLLRNYKVNYTTTANGTQSNTSIEAATLLGPITFIRRDNRGANNPLISEDLKSRLRTYAASLEQRGLEQSARYKAIVNYLNVISDPTKIPHSNILTSEDLSDIFIGSKDSDGNLTKISGGFGLRTPSPNSVNNKDTNIENQPVNQFVSHLSRIDKTRIIVAKNKNAVPTEQVETVRSRKYALLVAAGIDTISADTIEEMFPQEEIAEFISTLKSNTLEEALEKFRKNAKEKLYYETEVNNKILSAVQSRLGIKTTTKEMVKQDLIDSVGVIDNLKPYASIPTPFLRASVLIKLLGVTAVSPKDLFPLLSFVRKNYGANNYRGVGFAEEFLQLVVKYNTDVSKIIPRINEISAAYKEVADELGIPYRPLLIDENLPQDVIYQMIVDGLIFTFLEGGNINGQYLKGVSEFGREARQKHLDNQINLAAAFTNIVDNTVVKTEDINTVIEETPDDKIEQKVEQVVAAAENKVVRFAENLLEWINNNADAEAADIMQEAYNIDDDLAIDFINNQDAYDNWVSFLKDVIKQGTLSRSKSFLTEDIGTPLSMKEVENLVDRYTPRSFFSMLREIVSGNAPRELFNIVEYGKLVNNQGKQVWGLYKNGVLHFAKLASGGVSSKVVRHELFHKIFWEYLKPSEQIAALALAQEKYGNLSPEALEEALAEEFEDFVVTKRKSLLSRLWEKLKRLLGFSYNHMNSIEEFFNLIENKTFYKSVRGFESVERSSVNVRAVFDNYDEFKIVKDIILEKVVRDQVERRKAEQNGNVPVKSFAEITVDAMAYLQTVKDMDAADFPEGYTPDQINTVKRAVTKALNNKDFLNNFNNDYFSDANNRVDFIEFLKDIRDRKLEEIRILREDITARLERGEEVSADEMSELEEDDEMAGISDETYDSMLVDPKTKLTGSIKQRLISIEYFVKNEKHYADLSTAFTIIVSKVASIPKGSLKESLEAMARTFTYNIKDKPNIKVAVNNYMSNMAVDILKKLNDPNLPKNISFRKDASHKFIYAVVDTLNEDVSQVTRNDLESNPTRYREFVIEAGKKVDDVINEIAEITSLTKENVAKVYYLYEDIDFIKSLLSSVGSLRKSKPYVWQKGFKYVYKMSGYIARSGGGQRTFVANVEFAFNDYVQKAVNENRRDLFTQDLKTKIAKAKVSQNIEDKTKAVNTFLKDIGVTKKLGDASVSSKEAVFERLSKSIDGISSRYNAALDAAQKSESDNPEDRITGTELLENEYGLLDEIANMINSHYTLAESGSYTRGDGKKAYGWIDASWQTDVFNIFQRIKEKLPFKKLSIFELKDGKISSNDVFLKDNIFFTKKNDIFETVDHDSIKWKDGSKFAKTLRKENLKEFRERNIAGNFFVTLANRGGKYYQALPIPSNRTSVQAVLVNSFRTQETIDEAILQIIRAQKNRPDPDAKNPDGSLVHPELNNSKTYRERWKEFTFAGLSGNVDSMTEQQALKAVKQHVANMVNGENGLFEAFKEELNSPPEVQIPTWAISKASSLLGLATIPKWDNNLTDQEKERFFKQKNAAVKKGLEYFYYNYVINQYSLSQIVYGDETFYKSKEDQTKRIQIATATGDTLLVDEKFGMPKTSKVLVVEDLKRVVDPTLHDMLASSYDQEYEASDAEGFMLPEFYEKLASAYGFDAKADVILKPVYFSIENGVPRAIKYSVKVLTPELIKQYPHLASYADAMRAKGVDQMVFASAVKIGSPAVKAKLDETGRIIASSLDEKAIVNINNENLRFQLNPAKNVEGSVANKSQGTAMMNTNGKNTAETFEMHKANAFIIENGLRGLSRKLRLTRKGGVTKGTENKIRRMLTSLLQGLPGARDVYEMLSLGTGKNKVPLDMPLIGDRVLSNLSSIFTKATTGFRFPGSKLVLQADLGPVEIDGVMRNLKWRDENGFCEVILPETYRPYVEQIKDGIIGFRIPTSNYHSLVPLKVVGFYPVPPGSKGNVIIAPSLIVYYHGSDYDIDTLFVARKDYPNETINLNELIKGIDPEHQDDPKLIVEANEPYGFKNNELIDFDGYKLYEYLDKHILKVNKQLESLTKQLQGASELQKEAIENAIEDKEKILQSLSDIAEYAAKNFIVHNFSTNMRNMKNRKDLLTPISFDKIITLRSELKKELSEKLDDDKFLQTLEESGLIKQICQ